MKTKETPFLCADWKLNWSILPNLKNNPSILRFQFLVGQLTIDRRRLLRLGDTINFFRYSSSVKSNCSLFSSHTQARAQSMPLLYITVNKCTVVISFPIFDRPTIPGTKRTMLPSHKGTVIECFLTKMPIFCAILKRPKMRRLRLKQ